MNAERRDPFDLLVAMVPPPAGGPLPLAAVDMLERIMTDTLRSGAPGAGPDADTPTTSDATGRHARPRVRARHRVAIGAVVGLTVVGAGALAAVWESRPDDAATLVCYSDASTDPRQMVGVPAADGVDDVELCAGLWSDGTFARSGAPELTACVTDDGVTAVMPGDESTCARLGFAALAPPSGAERSGQEIDRAVARTIAEVFVGRCIDDLDVARAEVQAALDDLGASTWTVSVTARLDAVRRCAAPSVDAATRVIQIVAVPG